MIRASKNFAGKSSRELAQFSYSDHSRRSRVNSAEVTAVVAGGLSAPWPNSSFRSRYSESPREQAAISTARRPLETLRVTSRRILRRRARLYRVRETVTNALQKF